jgi:colanic acid biosynthesis glycosyl transferase WcaI
VNIIVYSIFSSPELTGVGKYNGEMLEYLSLTQDNVYAVVPPPYYPEWKVHEGYKSHKYNKMKQGNLTVIRCPIYVPKQMSVLKRIIYLFSFSFSSMLPLFSLFRKKIDVIVVTQPTLFCVPVALLFAKLGKCKTVLHIQDFEVDAMLGLNMMNDNWVVKIIKKFESFLIRRFDLVSSISYSMLDRAIAKGVSEKKLTLFPNWSDTEFVTPTTCGKTLKREWGFSEKDKVILYAGNIGQKQGLEVVLETAKHYTKNTHVKFVLVGTGVYLDTLKKMVEQQNITNLFFKPLQPWERVPEMLALTDIHLVVQKKGAADAVLPSKLTNILSAGGHALVTAEAHTELGQISQKYPGIYTTVDPESTQAFIIAVDNMLAQDISNHNEVARQYAEKYLTKNKILNQFVIDLKKLVGN